MLIYRVTVADRENGQERVLDVEAATPEEAEQAAIAAGWLVATVEEKAPPAPPLPVPSRTKRGTRSSGLPQHTLLGVTLLVVALVTAEWRGRNFELESVHRTMRSQRHAFRSDNAVGETANLLSDVLNETEGLRKDLNENARMLNAQLFLICGLLVLAIGIKGRGAST